MCSELSFIEGLDAKRRATIEHQFHICNRFAITTDRVVDTPYTTIVHRDLWTNNIMIKRGKFKFTSILKYYKR